MNKKVNDFSSLFSDELKDIAYRLHILSRENNLKF